MFKLNSLSKLYIIKYSLFGSDSSALTNAQQHKFFLFIFYIFDQHFEPTVLK